MSYQKQNWVKGEIISAEKLNHLEDGISNIELTPGPQGPAGPKGDKGDTGATGLAGKNGSDAKQITKVVINTDATDKVTGGTVTFTDESTVEITINKAGA